MAGPKGTTYALDHSGESRMNTTQQREVTLGDILTIEDDLALLDYQCNNIGIPVWPLVRVPFLRAIMSAMLYGTPLVNVVAPNFKAVGALCRATAHNAIHKPIVKSDILIMARGMGNQIKDGRWFNRVSDHFALTNENRTLVLEDFFNWQWPFPRHNNRVLFYAPIQVASVIVGRVLCRKIHLTQARQLVSLVRKRGQKILGWDIGEERTIMLVHLLARRIAAIPWLYRRYRVMLQRVQPKILMKGEACYGPSAVLMRVASDLGVVTAEYQHGVVSAGHDAYNLSPTLRNSIEYKKTLPDYFLGYGQWWNNQINVPVTKIAIGNPHRSEQLKQYAIYPKQERTDILVLSDGIETNLHLDLARQLIRQLGNKFTVVFRPHPMERTAVTVKYSGGVTDGVRIDKNDDIYQSFLTAYAVVGELSTGLFEAIGFVGRIFIWDTRKARFYFPNHPFCVFGDASNLASQLFENNGKELTPEQNQEIWAPNWRENYQQFLAGIGVKPA